MLPNVNAARQRRLTDVSTTSPLAQSAQRNDQPVILITGCSTGIGRDCAVALQKRGWRVFASARQADDVAALVTAGFYDALQLDVNDDASIQAAVAHLLAQTDGRIHALFNNAGFGQPGALEDLPRQALREQFETNVFGAHALTKAVLPAMRAQGHGRIVQHSSVLGFISLPWRGAYNASKYALEGLSDTLRQELHGSGIKAVLIQTGPVSSQFRANGWLKFKHWVDADNSVHRQAYQAVIERLESHGEMPFTLTGHAVARKLIHAVESTHPKARYHVTVPTHLFKALKRLLPTRWLDTVIRRING